MLKKILFLFVFYGLQPYPGMAQTDHEGLTTFILVRHAEKVDDSRDPELSAEGIQRAEALTRMLENIPVDAVFTTDYNRTRETVKPLAELNGVTPKLYNPGSLEAAAESWIRDYAGKTILISGHSNTTPMLANSLLGREYFPEKFKESDYGNLLVITRSPAGETSLLHFRY